MTSLLFVHGILGKPDYFDFLRPCVPDGFRVEDVLLEGHGQGPREFARASMARWREQVAESAARLRSDGSKVLIAAHSMGTLFAIENAVRGNADGLFLLNPPLKLRLTRRSITMPIKVFFGRIDDECVRAAKAAYSISDDPNLLHYVGWIPRYVELLGEIRRTRAIAGRIDVPTRVFLAARDEMVSPRSAMYFKGSPAATVAILPSSVHYHYPEPDRAAITAAFGAFASPFK